MAGMLRDARLFYSLLLERKRLGKRIGCRLVVFLPGALHIQGGNRCGLGCNAKDPREPLRKLEPGLYTGFDHAEKQQGHKGKGERDQSTFPEEITEVQIVKKAADGIAEFAAAKGSTLLLRGEGCIRRRQLKLFHK